MKLREYLPSLGTTVLRGIGYRAQARDGWRAPIRSRWLDARADALSHNTEGADE